MSVSTSEELEVPINEKPPGLGKAMFKNPLVPAGLIATVGCLGGMLSKEENIWNKILGLILGSTFSGPHRTAVWAGRRVIAQGVTLSLVLATMSYTMYKYKQANEPSKKE